MILAATISSRPRASFGIELSAPGPRHFEGRLGRFQARGRFIELLIRDRFPGRQLFHAFERTARQVQIGLGARHAVVGLGDALRTLASAASARRTLASRSWDSSVTSSWPSRTRSPTCTRNLTHISHDLAREHGGAARANGAGGLVRSGHCWLATVATEPGPRTDRGRPGVRLAAAAAGPAGQAKRGRGKE